jgi:hypothetical protein
MLLQNDFYLRSRWFSLEREVIDDDSELSHVRKL